MRKNEHYQLGVVHAMEGYPRYKWQCKENQEDYDRGYDAVKEEASLREFVIERIERRDKKW